MSARSVASVGAMSLPDSARQREAAAALDAALQHSAAEVEDLLCALGMASGEGADAALLGSAAAEAEDAVVAVRAQLAEAHARVQGAAARMRGAADEANSLKAQHADLRQQVRRRRLPQGCGERMQPATPHAAMPWCPLASPCLTRLLAPQVTEHQRQVDAAQQGLEAALQSKQGAEAALAR